MDIKNLGMHSHFFLRTFRFYPSLELLNRAMMHQEKKCIWFFKRLKNLYYDFFYQIVQRKHGKIKKRRRLQASTNQFEQVYKPVYVDFALAYTVVVIYFHKKPFRNAVENKLYPYLELSYFVLKAFWISWWKSMKKILKEFLNKQRCRV